MKTETTSVEIGRGRRSFLYDVTVGVLIFCGGAMFIAFISLIGFWGQEIYKIGRDTEAISRDITNIRSGLEDLKNKDDKSLELSSKLIFELQGQTMLLVNRVRGLEDEVKSLADMPIIAQPEKAMKSRPRLRSLKIKKPMASLKQSDEDFEKFYYHIKQQVQEAPNRAQEKK